MIRTGRVVTTTTLLLASILHGCTASVDSNGSLIVGATLITMEPGPVPEAMLVKDGVILALGSEEELTTLNPRAERIELSGKTVMPGVIDSHVHVREFGLDAMKVDLTGVRSMSDIVARIRAQRPDPAVGEWVIGQGWDEGLFADLRPQGGGMAITGGYPTTDLLSEAFPDTPVALESLHGFAGMANDAALAKAGINGATGDPDGGTILRRADGRPTGVLLALAQQPLFDAVPPPTQSQREAAIRRALIRMSEAGVTSIHEAGMTADDVAAFQALAARGDLPIRVYGLLNGNDPDLMAAWFARGPLDDPQDWLDIRGIKIFYDGSLGSRTALLRDPYSDQPDQAQPLVRIPLQTVEALSQTARRRGFQMAVHAIGDLANDQILTSYERRLAPDVDGFVPDHRWRIEHAQVVRPDFPRRSAKLGVIASMQPSHAVGDSSWAEDRLGHRRIRRAYIWKPFQQTGVPILFNSDLPGEPWEPMQTLHFATTRTRLDGTPPGGWRPQDALDRASSLHAMTLAGAHAAFQDDRLGSLAPGKWADFIVLSDNPLTAEDLLSIEVEATYVAGQRVGPTTDRGNKP